MHGRKIKFFITVLLTITFMAMPLLAAERTAKAATKPQLLEGKININTATAKQFALLPGIGKKTAQAIADYRTKNGNFKTVEDLLQVKGIGKKTLEKIKDFMALEGESTLAKK